MSSLWRSFRILSAITLIYLFVRRSSSTVVNYVSRILSAAVEVSLVLLAKRLLAPTRKGKLSDAGGTDWIVKICTYTLTLRSDNILPYHLVPSINYCCAKHQNSNFGGVVLMKHENSIKFFAIRKCNTSLITHLKIWRHRLLPSQILQT